jgi:hypothetical protein
VTEAARRANSPHRSEECILQEVFTRPFACGAGWGSLLGVGKSVGERDFDES